MRTIKLFAIALCLCLLPLCAGASGEVVLNISIPDKNISGLTKQWTYKGRWSRLGGTTYKNFEAQYQGKGDAIFTACKLGGHKGYSEIVECDYTRLGNGWGGLLLHVQPDGKSYYRLRISTSSRDTFPAKIAIAKIENGREHSLGWSFTDTPILLKKWYNLRAITDNNGRLGLEVWDTGQNKRIGALVVRDKKPLKGGFFGVTDSNCPGGTRWKNLRIKITQKNWWKEINAKKTSEDEGRRRPHIGKAVYSTFDNDYLLAGESAMVKVTAHNIKDVMKSKCVLNFHLAKNEYESKQIVVIAAKNLKKVKIKISDLRSKSGELLSASNIEWNPVDYIYVHKPLWAPEGLYPDPLLPVGAIDLQPGDVQPFLLTVYSGLGQKTGTYRGTIRVLSENSTSTEIPISVKVYNVIIPGKNHARADFWFHQWFWEYFYDRPLSFADYKRWCKFFGKYRVTPGWLQISFALSRGLLKIDSSDKDNVKFDFSELVKWEAYAAKCGANAININGTCNPSYSYLFPLDKFSKSQQIKATMKYYREHLKALRAKGLAKYAFLESFDEAEQSNRISVMKKWHGLVKQYIPSLKRTFAGARADRDYSQYVDIWCPLLANYDPKLYRRPEIAAKETWFYTCSGADHPLPDLLIFSPGIMHRIIPYMMFRFDVTGYLFWGLNYWQPLRQNRNASIKHWPAKQWKLVDNVDYERAGDGILCYPGPNAKPCASLRLVDIRDGFEDYELMYQARQKGKSIADEITKLVQSKEKYVSSPSVLEAFRIKLLQSLEGK